MHTSINLIRILVIAISALAWIPLASATGQLYKWIDENGQIRYGDHIPAQYAKTGNERLSKQGLVVNTKDPAKTEEQRAEEQRLADLAEQEEKRKKDRALHDRILLDTFTNEEEMVLTRQTKIEAIEANIRVTNSRIEKLRNRLADLNRRAANMERSGKPVPDRLSKQITESRAQIQYNLKYIENRTLEQQAIREKFEYDIARFHELKAAAAEQQP